MSPSVQRDRDIGMWHLMNTDSDSVTLYQNVLIGCNAKWHKVWCPRCCVQCEQISVWNPISINFCLVKCCHEVDVVLQICTQKPASGVMDKSDSQLAYDTLNVLFIYNIILYILESRFVKEDILISSEIEGRLFSIILWLLN